MINDSELNEVSGGTKIPYVVVSGDTLSAIAQKNNVFFLQRYWCFCCVNQWKISYSKIADQSLAPGSLSISLFLVNFSPSEHLVQTKIVIMHTRHYFNMCIPHHIDAAVSDTAPLQLVSADHHCHRGTARIHPFSTLVYKRCHTPVRCGG